MVNGNEYKSVKKEKGRGHIEKHRLKQNAKLQFRVGRMAFRNNLFSKCY